MGAVGTLSLGTAALPWQVVGYAERAEVSASADDENADEQSFWREYLLYHRTQGFAFIVDAQDGWSWTAPLTGVPSGTGDVVKYEEAVYRKLYDYTGVVTYVLGEFYWQVTQNQRTLNTDYQGTGSAGAKRLNREQTGSTDAQEVVWSGGQTLSADAVMKAFRLAPDKSAALQRDALPTSFNGSSLLAKLFLGALILVVVLMLFRCGSGSGGGSSGYYGGSGGSYGGFSSGGGHK
jgi:hypothetical protein